MTAEKDKVPQSGRPAQILVHYDEITLKGRNRRMFEKALHASVKRALSGTKQREVKRTQGRIVVEIDEETDVKLCLERLQQVFGITRIMPVTRLPADMDAIESWLESELPAAGHESFAILCKRANKSLPFTSLDVHERIGEFVREKKGLRVDLTHPDIRVFIRLVHRDAYVGFQCLEGQGGLPFATTGKVVSLLSGGIDSPVASHHIMRRGARPTFVHFHSFPHTSAESQEKVRELATLLLPHEHRTRLYMVPFADVQQRIIMECPASFRVILYRRFMMRAAEAIAKQVGALATVTGDSLGQVASQTLENLESINAVTTMPVLRPLIGSHKIHIITDARRIGTYDLSIEPHDDCCSFLMPQNPATYSKPAELEKAEAKLDVTAEVAKLVEGSTMEYVIGKS